MRRVEKIVSSSKRRPPRHAVWGANTGSCEVRTTKGLADCVTTFSLARAKRRQYLQPSPNGQPGPHIKKEEPRWMCSGSGTDNGRGGRGATEAQPKSVTMAKRQRSYWRIFLMASEGDRDRFTGFHLWFKPDAWTWRLWRIQ